MTTNSRRRIITTTSTAIPPISSLMVSETSYITTAEPVTHDSTIPEPGLAMRYSSTSSEIFWIDPMDVADMDAATVEADTLRYVTDELSPSMFSPPMVPAVWLTM